MKIKNIVITLGLLVGLSSCNSSEKLTEKAAQTEQKAAKKQQQNKDIDMHTPIHLVESYGSVCCPKDPKHDRHIKKYIAVFEKTNNVDITTYYVVQGKEGEATYFVNLDKLNGKQQAKFLMGYLGTDAKATAEKLKNPLPLKKLVPEGFKLRKL